MMRCPAATHADICTSPLIGWEWTATASLAFSVLPGQGRTNKQKMWRWRALGLPRLRETTCAAASSHGERWCGEDAAQQGVAKSAILFLVVPNDPIYSAYFHCPSEKFISWLRFCNTRVGSCIKSFVEPPTVYGGSRLYTYLHDIYS
jgi:hypothetical protein